MQKLLLRVSLTLRIKLVLVAMSLLLIPWVGFKYVSDMESYLRTQQETNLANRAQIISAALADNEELFTLDRDYLEQEKNHLYVRPLVSQIQLDGYADEWEYYQNRIQRVSASPDESTLAFSYNLGSYDGYFYAIFQITDDAVVYTSQNDNQQKWGDHLGITIQDKQGKINRYILSTQSPGWLNAYKVGTSEQNNGFNQMDLRIQGAWLQTKSGYNLELQIPITMIGTKIAFYINDIDDENSRQIKTTLSTSGNSKMDDMGTVVIPSPHIYTLLKRLEKPLTRIWVIDMNNRVVGLAGQLTPNPDEIEYDIDLNPIRELEPPQLFSNILRLIYSAVLIQPKMEFHDDLSLVSRLEGKEFRSAISGKPAMKWRQTSDKNTHILTVTHPVRSNDLVFGAVAIEETNNNILLLQNKATEILINSATVTFIIILILLVFLATRMSYRIGRLQKEADQAITLDGRVVGTISNLTARDEIGELSKTISRMLERLLQYNRYLETMATKLSHELRTPVSVVRSTIDNLETNLTDKENITILARARYGIDRLSNILSRMSEATRLEQSIQSEEKGRVNLKELISSCIDGYRIANPEIELTLHILENNSNENTVSGSADLLAQMLDKLISNAIDFHVIGTVITIKLSIDSEAHTLLVCNSGPPLPINTHQIFDSMVSMRSKTDNEEPHLGLGLHIVRLIVDYHGASINAYNIQNPSGVCFEIVFPTQNS